MKLGQLPLFCGGKFLFGLSASGPIYNTQKQMYEDRTDDMVIKEHFQAGAIGRVFAISNNSKDNSIVTVIPPTLNGFQRLLKYMLRHSGNAAVLYAVTNKHQTKAADFLEKTKFKKIVTTYKQGETECTSWIGDVHRDIIPILMNVEDIDPINYR